MMLPISSTITRFLALRVSMQTLLDRLEAADSELGTMVCNLAGSSFRSVALQVTKMLDCCSSEYWSCSLFACGDRVQKRALERW